MSTHKWSESERPACWATTQNLEEKWSAWNPVLDPAPVYSWSAGRGDNDYRCKLVRPGDPIVHWMTDPDGGVARVGVVLRCEPTPDDKWVDDDGLEHSSPWTITAYAPPIPGGYLHVSGLALGADCELVSPASQSPAPLALTRAEFEVITEKLYELEDSGFWHSAVAIT